MGLIKRQCKTFAQLAKNYVITPPSVKMITTIKSGRDSRSITLIFKNTTTLLSSRKIFRCFNSKVFDTGLTSQTTLHLSFQRKILMQSIL